VRPHRPPVQQGVDGAQLDGAQLQGAELAYAELQGASLYRADLQGASLTFARLQGASLTAADLQGASLDGAQLQGASLTFARLEGASLANVYLWRARASKPEGAYVEKPVTERKHKRLDCPPGEICLWSADSYAALVRIIRDTVPAGERQKYALNRISRLDPDKEVEESYERWADLTKNFQTLEEYRKNLVGVLRAIACDATGAPYVIGRLWHDLPGRFGVDVLRASELATEFLNEAKCPGARGLSEEDRVRLRIMRDRARPQSVEPGTVADK
jgi:hypothetical protein